MKLKCRCVKHKSASFGEEQMTTLLHFDSHFKHTGVLRAGGHCLEIVAQQFEGGLP